LFANLQKWPDTEVEFRKVQVIWEKLVADVPLDPDYRIRLAGSHYNLAKLNQTLGKPEAAAAELGKALVINEKLSNEFPTEHKYRVQLSLIYNQMALQLCDLKRWDEAEANFRKAMPIFEKLNAEFPTDLKYRQELGRSHTNLAVMLNMAGRLEEAEAEHRKALPIREKLAKEFPENREYLDDLTISQYELAVVLMSAGKPIAALPLLLEAAESVEKRRFQHTSSPLIVGKLIDCHELLKHFDQAEVWRRKRLALIKEEAGSDSLPFAAELATLGFNLLHQTRWTDAEAILRDCLAVLEKKEPDAWTTFNARSMLGGALLGQKKYADAEPLLVKGYEGMKKLVDKIPQQGKIRLTEAVERLISLHEATGKKDEVAKWRKELESLKMPEP
jgi:tetratricopeptide (TPR) repeat protein